MLVKTHGEMNNLKIKLLRWRMKGKKKMEGKKNKSRQQTSTWGNLGNADGESGGTSYAT